MVVDGGKLVLVNLTNNQRTNVISGIIDPIAGNPVWSRNVNTVIFAAQPKDKGASLYAVAPSGGTPRKLLDNQPANSSDENPVLSPDGKLVAFTRTFDSTKDGKYNEQDTQQEIWLMSPNGQNLRKLADGHHPAFAPDSQRIVYATNGENNSLKMTNTQGQNTWEPFNTTKIPEDLSKFDYPFVGSASVVEYPSFIEGGRGLVFSANRGSGGMIITINTTNGGDFKLWSGVHEGSVERTYPNPATRAKFMYVSLPPSGVKQAIVLDVTKAKVGVTLDGRTQFGSSQAQTSAVYPAWSPDGTKIAYFFTKDLDYTSPTVKGALVIATARADGTYETKEIYSGSFTGVAWEVE
jgi:Tol biopolymer transport system component